MQNSIISFYDNSNLNSYKATWKRLFKEKLEKLNLQASNSNDDVWNFTIAEKLKNNKRVDKQKEANTLSDKIQTKTSSTSSLSYQALLNENDY